MRDNGPVTQQAYEISADTPLFSTTALQRRITYCNSAFIVDTGRSAKDAETAVDQVNELIGRISVASIDGITQQNSALVEQLSASAISLAQRAELVTQSVRVFRLNGSARPA